MSTRETGSTYHRSGISCTLTWEHQLWTLLLCIWLCRSKGPLACPQLLEDEDSADEDFWNQEFFEEEAGDIEYNSSNASESEAPDVPDTDFDESVRFLC